MEITDVVDIIEEMGDTQLLIKYLFTRPAAEQVETIKILEREGYGSFVDVVLTNQPAHTNITRKD